MPIIVFTKSRWFFMWTSVATCEKGIYSIIVVLVRGRQFFIHTTLIRSLYSKNVSKAAIFFKLEESFLCKQKWVTFCIKIKKISVRISVFGVKIVFFGHNFVLCLVVAV